MPKRKEPEQYAAKGKKMLLHPCQLQELYGTSFVRTANQVLQGQLTLLSFRPGLALESAAGQEAN